MPPRIKYASAIIFALAIAAIFMGIVVGFRSFDIPKSLKIIVLLPFGFAAFALVVYVANASKPVSCPKCNYPLSARKSQEMAGRLFHEYGALVPPKTCSSCGHDLSKTQS